MSGRICKKIGLLLMLASLAACTATPAGSGSHSSSSVELYGTVDTGIAHETYR